MLIKIIFHIKTAKGIITEDFDVDSTAITTILLGMINLMKSLQNLHKGIIFNIEYNYNDEVRRFYGKDIELIHLLEYKLSFLRDAKKKVFI